MSTKANESAYNVRIRNVLTKRNLPDGIVYKQKYQIHTYEKAPKPIVFSVPWPSMAENDEYSKVMSASTIRVNAYVTVQYNTAGKEYNLLTIKYSRGTDTHALGVEFYYIDTITCRLTELWHVQGGDTVYMTSSNYEWMSKVIVFVEEQARKKYLEYCLSGVERHITHCHFVPDTVDVLEYNVMIANQYKAAKQRAVETKPRRRYRTKARIAQAQVDGTLSELMTARGPAINYESTLKGLINWHKKALERGDTKRAESISRWIHRVKSQMADSENNSQNTLPDIL